MDNIQIKPKKANKFPLLLAPIGAACAIVALVAILIPTLLKSNTTVVSSISSSSRSSGQSSIVDNKPHIYNFNLGDYQPTFKSFNEVAYYSYAAYNSSNINNNVNNNGLRLNKKLEAKKVNNDELEAYDDCYGRTHYPIPLNDPLSFSDFLYFEFDAEGSDFLTETVGNGHIKALIVTVHTFTTENMLILKNGESYYSCLTNGGGVSYHGVGPAYYQFSSHKTFDGFEIIKDFNNKREVMCYFNEEGNALDPEALITIGVEETVFSVDRDSIYYDNVTVISTIGGIRELFGLDPEFEIINGYGGPDQLVYDTTLPETTNFTLDEFEGTFRVNEDKLYLGENEIINLNGATKIYASDVNRDYHRDLVFESVVETHRMINIYDVYRCKYLYQEPASENGVYDYYLDMRSNHLVVNLFENNQLLDYGYLGYHGSNGIDIEWQNLYGISHLEIKGVYEADGVTQVLNPDSYYHFNSNVPYIIELELIISNESPYPSTVHQITVTPAYASTVMPNLNLEMTLLSVENGVYRCQIQFAERGYSCYSFNFYRHSCELRVAVDEPVEEPIENIEE